MIAAFDVNSLGVAVGAAGTLGTACSGIVDGLKWTPLGMAGYPRLHKLLGSELMDAVRTTYGARWDQLLRSQYRQDWARSPIGTTLRQGVKAGLNTNNAPAIAKFLGNIDGGALAGAVERAQRHEPPTDDDSAVMSRFEQALDTQIEGALAGAQDFYHSSLKLVAGILAIGMSELTAYLAGGFPGWIGGGWLTGMLVGIVAVPLAPLANDVANALQATSVALRGKS